MTIQSFRDLRVWQASMRLAEEIYQATGKFPGHELYSLTSQMRRASVSIPSNIAEGHSREHMNEYLHHLSFAQASLAELETQVELARRLTYLTPEACAKLMEQIEPLGKQIHSLRKSLSASRQTKSG